MKRTKQARAFVVAVGGKIRETRKAARLTQVGLGKKLDIDAPTVSRIESGKKDLRTSELYEVGRALGTSPAILVAVEAE
jgi:transcriptional regulator with XRE-family HTH domain